MYIRMLNANIIIDLLKKKVTGNGFTILMLQLPSYFILEVFKLRCIVRFTIKWIMKIICVLSTRFITGVCVCVCVCVCGVRACTRACMRSHVCMCAFRYVVMLA